MSSDLGVPRKGVRLEEYNPKWKDYFEEEKARLLECFPGVFLEISHGGSTAIPGMKAKPIIDIFAAVDDLNVYKKIRSGLEEMGYEYRGERGVPGRQLFVKGNSENRTHHLQITTRDNEQWKNHILLREYYARHPEVVREYIKLKEELATKFADDRASYTSGKNEFLDTVLKKAKAESAVRALKWIAGILNDNNIPYRLGGGVAAHLYGSERPVNDIDISISGKYFETLVPLVQAFVVAGPKHYKNEKWDCTTLSLLYNGQDIDLTDVDTLKMSDREGKRWIKNKEIYDKYPDVVVDVEGVPVTLMNPRTLIEYKHELGGAHQDEDIAFLKSKING